jgi:hypothetical protein
LIDVVVVELLLCILLVVTKRYDVRPDSRLERNVGYLRIVVVFLLSSTTDIGEQCPYQSLALAMRGEQRVKVLLPRYE